MSRLSLGLAIGKEPNFTNFAETPPVPSAKI